MKLNKLLFSTILSLGIGALPTVAQIYSGPTDTTHAIDPAIASNDNRLTLWADSVVSYTPAPGVNASYADPTAALGAYNTSLVSLGDLSAEQIANSVAPGTITLGFSQPFRDVAGFDFAIFENGFAYGQPNGLFMELGYVEVSSNGTDFVRFESLSTNLEPVAGSGAFAGYDTSNIYNLAGKHAGGYGTPFDLSTLANDPLVLGGTVDLDAIGYVRIVDIPGDGSFLDSEGNPILDNWVTTSSGGFDLRAIGAVSAVPEPRTIAFLIALGAFGFVVRRRLQTADSR